MHFFSKRLVGHRGAGVADDGERLGQPSFIGEPVKGRKELSFREISIGAEDHDCAFGHAAVEAQGVRKRIMGGHWLSTYHAKIDLNSPVLFRTNLPQTMPKK